MKCHFVKLKIFKLFVKMFFISSYYFLIIISSHTVSQMSFYHTMAILVIINTKFQPVWYWWHRLVITWWNGGTFEDCPVSHRLLLALVNHWLVQWIIVHAIPPRLRVVLTLPICCNIFFGVPTERSRCCSYYDRLWCILI